MKNFCVGKKLTEYKYLRSLYFKYYPVQLAGHAGGTQAGNGCSV